MRAIYDVPAPAKLNLFLHVTGRRPDGYHLLDSVFMLIDWVDTLHFEIRPPGEPSREDLGQSLPADDLCLRAARALRQATGCMQGVHIAIDKRIPAQAGMGGGSSDAATCLLALNQLWQLRLGRAALEAIGLSLGADVPFFLRGRNARVRGVGEQITPVALPAGRFVVVKPQQGLETGPVFAGFAAGRAGGAAIISGFAANPVDSPLQPVEPPFASEPFEANSFKFGRNDLQPVAQTLCPGVTQALGWLGSHGLNGRMTGSGSAVFAPLSVGEALAPTTALPSGWQVRECSNVEAHPLVGWATSDD